MSRFLEKHVRHLNVDELRNYIDVEGVPPLIQDCLMVVDREFQRKEREFEEELGEQDERSKDELREEVSNLEEKLFDLIRTSSYEELEEKLEGALAHFRTMMLIKEN